MLTLQPTSPGKRMENSWKLMGKVTRHSSRTQSQTDPEHDPWANIMHINYCIYIWLLKMPCLCVGVLFAFSAVVKSPSLKLDPATGLSTTSSTLQYAASKEDADAVFTCVSTYNLSNHEIKLDPFPVHCEWNTPSACLSKGIECLSGLW